MNPTPFLRIIAAFVLFQICSTLSSAQTKPFVAGDTTNVDLLSLSFEDLLNVTIQTGTLSGITKHNIPVAMTTISNEDIRYSPARNLLDLIETYVPGALYMNHVEGPHPGIRGIIVDRSYKVLLLVNGKVLNQKTRNGASTELENWDMNDIERVEIIRGPGSVTYGPGAIMGVINIVTKSAVTSPGVKAFSQYVSRYHSAAAGISYGASGKDFDFYGYGSITRTPGFSPDAYAVDISTMEAGYVGKDFSPQSVRSNPVQRYLSDYHDQPQIKALMELNFLKSWKLWARYTSSGTTANGNFYKSRSQTGYTLDSIATNNGTNTYYRSPVYGKYEEIFSLSHKQFSAALLNDHHFANLFNLPNGVNLQSSLGYYNYSGRKGNAGYITFPYNTSEQLRAEYADKDSHWNQTYLFSESELLASVLANMKFGNNYKVALGSSYSYNYFGPAWGTSNVKLQNLNPYLDYQNNMTMNIANEWVTHTYSFFAELNFKFSPYLTLLVSGRTDRNTYSKLLVSPRIALISELNSKNILKLVAQQSQRMNNGEELRSQNEAGTVSDPETLQGIELLYTRIQSKKMAYNVSTFYNRIGVISWSGDYNTAMPTGDLTLAGMEAEARYTTSQLTFGLNHAFTKQLRWRMTQGITVSGISYSDYNLSFDDGVNFTGHGNDLNNWANHATKVFGRLNTFKKRLTLHADMRIFWTFEGAKDGLTMIEKNMKASSNANQLTDLMETVRSKNPYETDLRFNSSATLKVNESLSVTLFAINLFDIGNAKRYSYDAGTVVKGPSRVAFVEEPRSFGIRLNAAL